MMMGTADARMPRNPKRESRALKAPMAESPVFLPIATSAIMRENPKVTAMTQIDKKERASSILGGKVGETPDVPEPYRRPGRSQHKAQLAGKTASLIHL